MFLKQFFFLQICLLLFVSLTHGFQQRQDKSTASPRPNFEEQKPKTLNSEPLLNKDKLLSPEEASNKNEDSGFIEVKESEIPEGALVYVLEEPLDRPVDGESMKTADNIVFRPLFRYRGKQEAQRRNSRIRRRYFIPKRSYRQSYYYRPSYYNRGYYYG